MRVYSSDELVWRGNKLWIGRIRKLTEIVQDERYPMMWRVRRADGTLSDMLSVTRARDAARALALYLLNGQESHGAAPPVR